ncbi:uncharacterized protein LOC143636143 [Bidens hawaiensis]|uniref:uncharacterized protein LOC143636143 n=1 Tax=Bidens hawaiensis TaxID=980011 RepID=UPI00404A6E4D
MMEVWVETDQHMEVCNQEGSRGKSDDNKLEKGLSNKAKGKGDNSSREVVSVCAAEPISSQFWSDPEVVKEICDTVDKVSVGGSGGGSGCGSGGVGGSVGGSGNGGSKSNMIPGNDEYLDEPTFSLGITQVVEENLLKTPTTTTMSADKRLVDDELRTGDNEDNQEMDNDTEHVPLGVLSRMLAHKGKGIERDKRETRQSYRLRSPYMKRPVVIKSKEDKSETLVWRYIHVTGGPETESIFVTDEGVTGYRGAFESMQPNMAINSNVITCFSMVMNEGEANRSDTSLYRLLLGPIESVSSDSVI